MAMLCLIFNANSQINSKYKWGFSSFKIGFDSYSKITRNGTRLIVYNQTIPQMFAMSLGIVSDDRILIDAKQPKKLNVKLCYELNTTPDISANMFVLMQESLSYQYPEYTARIICKHGKVYALITDREEGILIKGNDLVKN